MRFGRIRPAFYRQMGLCFMADKLIISVSGLRGIVGEDLTAAVGAEYGCAFAGFLRSRRGVEGRRPSVSVCIGRDSRPSGEMLESAVAAGLCASGIDVIKLGIVPTPSVAVMIGSLALSGGVVITASHNPAGYNGIKLLLENGMAPPKDLAQQIKSFFLEKKFTPVDSLDCGRITSSGRTADEHITRILNIIDKNKIAEKKFKVVLDSVNGAGGPLAKKLLTEIGCRVVAVNTEPTGIFAHPPEPTAENLTGLCEIVKHEKADIGFAQDPDADRLAVVDEKGSYIGEEYTLALAAKYIFSKRKGFAAANLSTSRMIDDIAADAGCTVIRTAVGEANVAAAMLEHNCIIGGEGNGGVIDPRVCLVRDSHVAMALVLQLMAEAGEAVSRLARQCGAYYMAKDKFAIDPAHAQKLLDAVKEVFPDARLNTADGCRFDFDDGWLHIRTSNTEPIMRVIIEAKDRRRAEKYADAVVNLRKQILG